MKRLWSLHNINKPMFAVAYGKTLDEAIIRTCEELMSMVVAKEHIQKSGLEKHSMLILTMVY